jgi:hypothetical protein
MGCLCSNAKAERDNKRGESEVTVTAVTENAVVEKERELQDDGIKEQG